MKEKILRYAAWFGAAAWLVFMFALAAQSGEKSGELSGSVASLIGKILGISDQEALGAAVRKLAHFFGFFIEGALARLAVKTSFDGACASEFTLFAGAALCVLNELTQLLAVGRACSPVDMCVDFAGFALGACAAYTLVSLLSRRDGGDISKWC